MLRVSLLFYILSVITIILSLAGLGVSMEVGRTLLGISIGLVFFNLVTGVNGGGSRDFRV